MTGFDPLPGPPLVPVRQTLLWTPRAKGRPRTTYDWQHGGYRTYTDHRTRMAEKGLREQWVGTPIEGPIVVGLTMTDTDVSVTVLSSPDCESRKLKRGDLDNYTKLVLDALNGVAWTDDRRIVALSARKM